MLLLFPVIEMFQLCSDSVHCLLMEANCLLIWFANAADFDRILSFLVHPHFVRIVTQMYFCIVVMQVGKQVGKKVVSR